jgi:hypothetical protein
VTPSDGTDTGTAGSDAVAVVNTAPVVSAVSISPSSPTVSDPLICSYSFADDDTDTDASSVTWTVGSSTVGTGTTLSAGSATKGETVTCSVEADDGEDTGNTDTASTTIQNSAPTTPVVSISPTAPVAQTDDLVCSIDTASTDADNDTITTTFMWEVDGVSWTGSTSTTTEADDTVDAADLTYDEEWTCIVTPDDGTVSGTAGEDSVTVVCQDADGDGYKDDSCGGTDCDDSDSSLTPEDADGDGYSTCDGDCDDSDAASTLTSDDADCDGAKTADDCDDSDATIYPYAGDIYNDGIDSDCDQMDCEAGYSTTGVYYVVCGPQNATWATMDATCQAAGYDGMASIRDATENSDLQTLASNLTSLWGVGFGATDVDVEGTWSWFDGSEWTYDNWGSAHYGGTTNENCFEMDIGNATWNDCTCGAAGSSTGMVCQYRDACDKDGDGYDSDSTECGGLDCDDSDFTLQSADTDSDGYSTCDGDCDDSDSSIYPGAFESLDDGIDQDCDGGDDVTCAGDYRISADSASQIAAVEYCAVITGFLWIYDNYVLTNVEGLSNLTTVVGTLYFGHNATLMNVDGLSNLTDVGALTIYNNAALTDIDGLSSLTAVGANLIIETNNALCQDNVDDLVAACTIGGSVSTSANNGTCP